MSHSAGYFRIALILGLLSAIGPFAIDMYLPALPSIGQSLHASSDAVRMSLTAFFITISLCQLAYGPASDMLGRKLPIFFGLAVFALGSVLCAQAGSIEELIAGRVVEAIGACAGMVIPRAIVRDLHTGPEAAQLMSLLMLVFSVSPILAPLSGSQIVAAFGWRGVFWTVTVASCLGMVLATRLAETRPAAARAESSWREAFAAYRRLLGDRHFMALCFVGGFGMSTFFVYLANSSFVFIDHYGLTPTRYSVFFALNAISFFGVAQLTGRMTRRFGLAGVIRLMAAGVAATTVTLLLCMMLVSSRLEVMVVGLIIGFGWLGPLLPTTSVLALEQQGRSAGTASALMGALQTFTAAAVMALVSPFMNANPSSMIGAIAASAAITCALAYRFVPAPPLKAVVPAE